MYASNYFIYSKETTNLSLKKYQKVRTKIILAYHVSKINK